MFNLQIIFLNLDSYKYRRKLTCESLTKSDITLKLSGYDEDNAPFLKDNQCLI